MKKNLLSVIIIVSTILNSIAADDTLKLYFNTGQYMLSPINKGQIDSYISKAIIRKEHKLRIAGHTDGSGSFTANEKLSLNRASVVASYFISKGWSKSNIEIIGMGEIDSNDAVNSDSRRVDILGYSRLPETIFFKPGMDDIKPGDLMKLPSLLNALKIDPSLKVSTEGHSCCSKGNTTRSNSETRSKVIETYLINHGIGKERLILNPQGSDNLLYPKPANDEEHGLNCRVEIKPVR